MAQAVDRTSDVGRQRPAGQVWAVLALVTLLAAILRLYRLGHGGLWYDELIMARLTAGPWTPLWHDIWYDGRPPLYPILAWAVGRMLGSGDAELRLLSAGFGIAAVPALFAVGRRLFGTRAGLIAAGLLAVSPYQIYYAQEHRYYALLLLLGIISAGFLLRAWRFGEPATTQIRGRRWGSWILYILTSALMFYTHPIAALVLLSIGLAGVGLMLGRGITGRQSRMFLMSQVVILLLIMLYGLFPWVHGAPLLGEEDADLAQAAGVQVMSGIIGGPAGAGGAGGAEGQIAQVLNWVPTPPWWGPLRTWLNFMFLGKKYVPAWSLAAAAGLLLLGGIALLWRVGISSSVRQMAGAFPRAVARRGRSWWLVGCWTIGPVAALALGAWLWQPIYVDRYVIPSAAGLTFLLAGLVVAFSGHGFSPARDAPRSTAGATTLTKPIGGWPTWSSLGALVVVMGGATQTYYQSPDKGAWPEAVAWSVGQLGPGDVLAFASERGDPKETRHVRENWFWYAPFQRPRFAIELQMRQPTAALARQLRDALHQSQPSPTPPPQPNDGLPPAAVGQHRSITPGLWLVLWRDPDHPRGLEQALRNQTSTGLELETVRHFFDLTLMRFVLSTDPPGP